MQTPELLVPRVDDFTLDGTGRAPAWEKASWQALTRVGPGRSTLATRCKTVYSTKGLYFLFDCEDARLTCPVTEDFGALFNGDVVELFLWPDEEHPLYLEYELSPLDHELLLLVPNDQGSFFGWTPFGYKGERLARHATTVRGEKKAGTAATGWMAECFIPFAIMVGLRNAPPRPGTRWRANTCRIDYDQEPASHWSWSAATGANFHHFQQFGSYIFGE